MIYRDDDCDRKELVQFQNEIMLNINYSEIDMLWKFGIEWLL